MLLLQTAQVGCHRSSTIILIQILLPKSRLKTHCPKVMIRYYCENVSFFRVGGIRPRLLNNSKREYFYVSYFLDRDFSEVGFQLFFQVVCIQSNQINICHYLIAIQREPQTLVPTKWCYDYAFRRAMRFRSGLLYNGLMELILVCINTVVL